MSWITWPLRVVGFVLWFTKEVVVSNVVVLRDNLTRGQDSAPGVAAYPTRCRTDTELTCLAALITLTPGTLTLGTASRDGDSSPRVLYVHAMYSDDAEAVRAALRPMETRMLNALRRRGGAS